MSKRDYEPTPDDLEFVDKECGAVVGLRKRNGYDTEDGFVPEHPLDDTGRLCTELIKVAAEADGGDEYAAFTHMHRERIRDAVRRDSRVARAVVIGHKICIACGSATSMNMLGALYYMGELVEQDYAKAAELYEMAMNAGLYQSIINLGYIYEYGRIGEPDYNKAFQYYSLAAALAPSCEATYKLGDMFARGRAVERDMSKANALWERAAELADSVEDYAQPAARIAKLLMDPDCAAWGIEPDPLRALMLYQRAEIGLRLSIAAGATYYRKRLKEVIEGQGWARELVALQDIGD